MMRVLSAQEIREAVTHEELIRAVELSFAELAGGNAALPAVMEFQFPEVHGEAHVKGAHLKGTPYFVIKVAGGFHADGSEGLEEGAGLVLALSARSGQLEALLLDGGWLTDMRTGAAGAVAAKYLAHKELARIAVIGAGAQARHQLQALRCVRRLPVVSVWSRSASRATVFAEEMAPELGTKVQVAPRVEDAVREADLVITATPSTSPLVRAEWLSPGAHINAVGSDMPHKQELGVDVLQRADIVIADRLDQCQTSGEIHHALTAGVLRLDEVTGELGDVVLGRIPGRSARDQITVCDLTGVGVQDAAAAGLVLDASARLGLGVELSV
jgi:ornithine cyclodeaminase/alanine dehydrogenase-like protein (mu-crystallin family)